MIAISTNFDEVIANLSAKLSTLDGQRVCMAMAMGVIDRMHERIHQDGIDAVRYERHAYSLKDGEWKASCFLSQPVDKRPKSENAVAGCKQAIERYLKAKDDVKTSAEAMIQYVNEN